MSNKALVVLSGGADSTICLFLAKQKFDEVHAVTFNYGQRHSIELEAAKKVAEMAKVASHEIIAIPNVLTGKSFLTDLNSNVEEFDNFENMEHANSFKENKLDSSFVPMRNMLFLTLAANRAFVKNCSTLITGVTAADFAEYSGFSWEWLGGFIDAEGHFSEVNKDTSLNLRLSISQKDPEVLVRLGKWVKSQLPEVEYSTDLENIYFGIKALRQMAPYLTPHLHSPLRRNQAVTRGEGITFLEEAELSDAYVAGFWEGDGSYYAEWVKTRVAKKSGKDGKTRHAHLSFFQKDPTVLEKIQSYLGRGYLGQRHTQNQIWYLQVGDGPLGSKLIKRLSKHFNLLGTFKKITEAKHKVGLKAGGFNPPYPDCTPDFIQQVEESFSEALLIPKSVKLKIETPLMFVTKAQSVRLARTLPGCWEALAYSHTSYDGKYPPTGKNHANLLRAEGFEQAGFPDPLVLRAFQEGLMELPTTPNYTNYFE